LQRAAASVAAGSGSSNRAAVASGFAFVVAVVATVQPSRDRRL
jgi:hypothetical protein